MARKGENIYKRKDGRWEGRYIKSRSSTGKANYGYVYAKSYREVKAKLISQSSCTSNSVTVDPEISSDQFEQVAMEWFQAICPKVKEESTNNIQNYISYLIDLQEQFNPGLDMIGFVPYLVDTDSATIKSNLEELYKQHKEDNLVFQNIIKRSNKVSTWSKNGITEHKGYDKKVLSMYENVFFEMLERIIQLENEKE